jgi:putative peptidoglycan lipid II flippase
MNYALLSIGVNTALALLLFPIFGFLAVAFATVFAAWLQVIQLAWNLWKRGQFRIDGRLASRGPRMLIATLLMAGLVWFAVQQREALADALFGRSWAAVFAIAIGGVTVYGAALLALGAIKMSDYKAYSRNRNSF